MALPRTPPLVLGTVGGPVSGGFSERFASPPHPPHNPQCLGETIGLSEGDGERTPGRGQDCLRAPGDQQVFDWEACGGRELGRRQRGCTHSSCFSFSPRVPYLAVARAFEKIEEVSAR